MNRSIVVPLAAFLAGCSMQYPQTADEFRQQIPTATFGKVQTFEAKRSYREVAKTFQAKAPQCLNVAVRTVERGGSSTRTLKPTVLVNEKKTELHIQQTYSGNVIVPGKVPEGGMYYIVADATPIDRTRTRIDIYGPSMGADTLVRAITNWATGENVGCPDMTK
jgi:hypothetical protein